MSRRSTAMHDHPSDDLRQQLIRLTRSGPEPGRAWCAAWTEQVDRAITGAFERIPATRIAVVATGGFGRSELCPASDIDLLLLHDRVEEQQLRALVRTIVYPLWDAGLRVGHAVRDRRDSSPDLEALTAIVDARTICGDPTLLSEHRRRAIRELRRKPARFLDELTAATARRHARAGDAAEVLEPDLRDGAGGLRDVQALRWAASALLGEAELDPLVAAGYLGAADRSRLAKSYDLLLKVRVATHLATAALEGTRKDVLRLDVQHAAARRLGYRDSDRADAAHLLLHDVFRATRTIDHVHRRASALLRADASTRRRRSRSGGRPVDDLFVVEDGSLRLADRRSIADTSMPTRLLEALVTEAAVLDRSAAAELRRWAERRRQPLVWSPEDRDRLVAALWSGPPLIQAFAEIDDAGLLAVMLPEWEPLRARPQRHPVHRYSLDRHALHTVDELTRIVRDEPWGAATADRVGDDAGLVIGALLHDVGKAYGEPHAETGVPVADAITARLGLDADARLLVRTLVRLHLLLPEVAARRDTADPRVIEEVVAAVGDERTLDALHLIAAADGRATGPTAWTTWKAALVADLVARARAVLAGGSPVGPAPDASPLRAGASPSVTFGTGALEGHDTLRIAASSRDAVLPRVTGVLAIHRASVLAARSRTDPEGRVEASFVVQRPPDSTTGWWDEVRRDLELAIAGRLAVRPRVERRASTDRRGDRLPEAPVTVDVIAQSQTSIVEVRAPDRLGLLYAIVATLTEMGIGVLHVKVTTVGHEAIDTFTVQGPDGSLDEPHAAEVVLAVTAALAR